MVCEHQNWLEANPRLPLEQCSDYGIGLKLPRRPVALGTCQLAAHEGHRHNPLLSYVFRRRLPIFIDELLERGSNGIATGVNPQTKWFVRVDPLEQQLTT